MSYLVLARKWRPRTFAEVVGQRPVVKTLQNALRLQRVAHAMLFAGVRGVGKTTLARLMAKALNCREPEPAARPCNQCQSCQEINAGAAVDLHEIDGASNRGIQEIRELKENIRFLPVSASYKIVIIDEVHMLTTEAFNALLKTLEEPPAHVYFMFATTELHKIPITILSRCQRYELNRVPYDELLAFFRQVAAWEEVTISDAALAMISREADGSVRDGLSLLDQVFSFADDGIDDDDVRQLLGLVDRRVFTQLARALLAGELGQALEIFDRGQRAGMDLKRFAADLLDYFRNLVVCRATAGSRQLLELGEQEQAELEEIAAAHSPETLLYSFNLLLKGVEEMQYASRPKLVLEMTMVRAVEAGQIVPTAEALGRLEQLLAGLPADEQLTADVSRQTARDAGKAAPVSGVGTMEAYRKPAEAEVATKISEPEPALARTAADFGRPEPAPSREGSGQTPEPVGGLEPPPEPAVLPESAGDQPEAAGPPEPPADRQAGDEAPAAEVAKPPAQGRSQEGRDLRRQWEDFVRYVRQRKVWMASVLEMAAGVREENGELLLRYDDPADCKLLEETENSRLLTEIAQDFFQRELKVRLRLRGGSTVAMAANEQPREERRALANDPLVQTVTEIFNGEVAGIRTGTRGASG
ncbi:MAG: DNA polymerase III subunit gamma/tau [Desulfurivibrio sp.]|nr:DNA polymerase III subunit gamma/tau [Desulfurivibrio sp.]